MSLPIVIIFDRHWDLVPKNLLNNLLHELIKEGYDTLCLKGAGCDLTPDQIISRQE